MCIRDRPTTSAFAPVLFPNPGNDHFTLTLSNGPHRVTLVDAVGRIALQLTTPHERTVVGTAHLGPGVYTVRIDDAALPLRWVKE